jgi:threonine synthase
VVTVASTGNHGASTAAYAARASLDCVVFTLPEDPETMTTLMQVYGASVVATPASEDRWTVMQACVEEFDWYPTGNYVSPPVGSNHYGVEGYKTIAYEICEALSWTAPDWVVQPSAYADGLIGIWRGFEDLKRLGITDGRPKMVAVEPFGPLKNAHERDLDHVEPVETGDTVAFSIGASVSTYQGLHALRESNGTAVLSDDAEILDLQQTLGETAGVYAEASAVASLLGVGVLRDRAEIGRADTVVAVNTSTGLKDTDTTAGLLPDVPTIDPDLAELEVILEEFYDVSL